MKKSCKILALVLAAVMMLAMFSGCQESAGNNEESDVLIVTLSPDFSPMEFVDTSKLELQKIVRDGLDRLMKEMN